MGEMSTDKVRGVTVTGGGVTINSRKNMTLYKFRAVGLKDARLKYDLGQRALRVDVEGHTGLDCHWI